MNQYIIDYILKDIELSVARLGINTKFSINEEKICLNGIKAISSHFLTKPMLFKEIRLIGQIFIDEIEEHVKLTILLDYRYKTFWNGDDGHSLGNLVYVTSKEFWDKYKGINPSKAECEIDKIKGLAI